MAADVSIIVPAYNMERFLVETLDSIEAAIKPTSLAVEVIVMDDGSTDGSLALARNYAAHHTNIRVLTQPNAGPSVARNRAINEATGRYIFPLDADDLLGAGFLEHAVQILDTDPEVKAVLRRRPVFRRKTRAVATAPFFTHLAGPPESDMRQRTLPSDRLGTGRRLLKNWSDTKTGIFGCRFSRGAESCDYLVRPFTIAFAAARSASQTANANAKQSTC